MAAATSSATTAAKPVVHTTKAQYDTTSFIAKTTFEIQYDLQKKFYGNVPFAKKVILLTTDRATSSETLEKQSTDSTNADAAQACAVARWLRNPFSAAHFMTTPAPDPNDPPAPPADQTVVWAPLGKPYEIAPECLADSHFNNISKLVFDYRSELLKRHALSKTIDHQPNQATIEIALDRCGIKY